MEPGPASGSRAEVLTAIQPITDVDAIIAAPTVERAAFDLNDLIFHGFTVPAGERWRPGNVHGEPTTGNTHIRAVIGGVVITLTANDTNEKLIDVRGLILDESDQIGWFGTNNAGDTSRVLEVEMTVEARN